MFGISYSPEKMLSRSRVHQAHLLLPWWLRGFVCESAKVWMVQLA
jgi:hypothetical protein